MIFEAFPSFAIILPCILNLVPTCSLDLGILVSGDLPSLGGAQMMLAEGDSRKPSERAKTVTCLMRLLSIG